ncbi:cu(I)-responsive transcriptional regulator, partial [Vibrio parahaemolyticus EKP-021]
KSLPNHRRAN